MMHRTSRTALTAVALAFASTWAAPVRAANVLVVSNVGADAVVTQFTANAPGHVYTAFNANATPTLDTLNQYDAVLLFENGIFGNAPNVGNAIAAYYNQGGKCVVLGTFYWQDRSDNPKYNQPGWGALEAVDVFLADAGGSEYAPDSMDPNSIVAHPVTQGVASLSAGSYRGGVSAKPGTTVLATWLTLNELGKPDPVIGVREDLNGGKFVGISIFPDYESYGDYGVDFNGDFYKLWENAFSWCTDVCGDGAMDPGEECDDGNVVSGDGCTAQCDDEFCGDGVDNDGDAEECDDGNAVNTDACVSGCKLASCGDGFVLDGVEGCDDGNDVDDDGCTNGCALPSCGDGIKQQSEGCDDGDGDNSDACLDTCVPASCGDGFVHDGVEGCDDANADNTDACLESCVPAMCGDGFVQAGVEGCDDGNADDSDNCVAGCKPAICGDGFVYSGIEECDDGNAVDDDDCSNACTIPGDTSTGTDSGAGTTDGTTGDETTGDETTGDETTDATTGDATTGGTTSGGTTTGTTGGDSNSGGDSDSGTPTTGGGTTGGTTTGTTGDGSATGTGTDTAGAVDDGCGCSAATPEEGLRGGVLGLIGFGLLGRARRRRR